MVTGMWTCPGCGRSFASRNQSHVLHTFRLSGPDEVDTEFAAWLAEAYRVGAQEHLRRPR